MRNLEGIEFQMNIPLPKLPMVLAQQIQQLDSEKGKNSIHTDTGYRIPHQKGMLGVTVLCSPKSQCQQGQLLVKSINIAKIWGRFLFLQESGSHLLTLLVTLPGAAWSIAATSGSGLTAAHEPGKSSLGESAKRYIKYDLGRTVYA